MPTDDQAIRRYLLGDLAAAERDALEARYFADEQVLDEVEAVEDALVADFLDGRLAADERERMEKVYLATPAHRARVAVTRDLRRRAAAATATGRAGTVRDIRGASRGRSAGVGRASRLRAPWIPAAIAAAILAGAVGIQVFQTRTSGPPGSGSGAGQGQGPAEVPAPTAGRAQAPATTPTDLAPDPGRTGGPAAGSPSPGSAAAPAPDPAPAPAPPPSTTPARPVFRVSLATITLRSEGTLPTVQPGTVPGDIVLTIERPEAAAGGPFEVRLRSVDGEGFAWKGRATPAAGGRALRVTIPSEQLPADDYIVVVVNAGAPDGDPGLARHALRVAAPAER